MSSLAKLIDIHTEHSLVNTRDYVQYCSIDPATKNLAIRIERRYPSLTPIYVTAGYYDVWDISAGGKWKCKEAHLNDKLRNIMDLIQDCDYVIIEKQMTVNKKAGSVQDHIIAVLSFALQNNERRTKIYSISPKLKNDVLQPEKGDNLKHLSLQRAQDIFASRNEEYSLNVIRYAKKQDDLGDVVCQLEAFVVHMKLEGPKSYIRK